MLKVLLKRFLAKSRRCVAFWLTPFRKITENVVWNWPLSVWQPEKLQLEAESTLCLLDLSARKLLRQEIIHLSKSKTRKFFLMLCRLVPAFRMYGFHRLHLTIHSDLRMTGDSEFESLGVDPAFLVCSDSCCLPAGLAVVSFYWKSTLPPRIKMYYDSGSGISELRHIELAGVFDGYSRTLVEFPPCCSLLRVDPLENLGKFSFREVTVEEVRYMSEEKLETLRKKLYFLSPYYNLYLKSLSEEANVSLSYAHWIEHYERKVSLPLPSNTGGPLLSVLMPVYNPEPRWLEAAIRSVLRQSYQNWQLAIADDASTDPNIRAILEAFEKADSRISLTFRKSRGHISAASNTALEMVQGSYCVLLDHDDVLPSHALARVVEEIRRYPRARLIYSDEDKVLPGAEFSASADLEHCSRTLYRFDPYFKPDWDAELIRTQNFFSHLGVFESELIRSLGGFRIGTEGAQDWDLVLRASAIVRPEEIRHIPEILYHWRATQGSLALRADEKPYAYEAGFRVVSDFVQREKLPAVVLPHPEIEGGYRLQYSVSPERKATIIIPTCDNPNQLRDCIESIRNKTTFKNYEILVVDNLSRRSDTKLLFERFQQQGVLVQSYPYPFNFSAIVNSAVEQSSSELFVLLNDDTLVRDGAWLEELLSQAIRPEVGVVGARLLYADDTIQHAGIVLGVGGVATHAFRGVHVDCGGQQNRARLVKHYLAVTGACLVFRREIWESVGGFDEQNLPEAFNDVDFCLRAKAANYEILYTPFATLYHFESQTLGPLEKRSPERLRQFAKETSYMEKRWADYLTHDPNYHPNLNHQQADFLLERAASYEQTVGQEFSETRFRRRY